MNRTDGTERKEKSFRQGLVYGALAALLAVAVLYIVGNPYIFSSLKKGGLTGREAAQLVKELDTITREIDELYLEDVDHSAMLEEAYSAYVAAVGDKYTCYYTEEEYHAFRESTSGIYSGIGVTVTMDAETGFLTIVSIQEGGPADGTAIREGDMLLKADGKDLTGMKQDAIVALIKGEAGTQVTLELQHGKNGGVFTETLTRKKMETKTVRSELLENGTLGYIALEGFEEVTTNQFEEALTELQNKGIQGLIIDLRNNPGGRLDVVTEMLDKLLPEGIITYTEDKWGNRETFTSDAEHLELPLALLVNENSASASEIFAGAVKDYGIGTLVGTTTFGKGIVQRTMGLGDGTGLKITMARYYTPNGNYIHGVGVEPDIAIELPAGVVYGKNLPHEEDIQLQTAIEAVKTKLGQ